MPFCDKILNFTLPRYRFVLILQVQSLVESACVLYVGTTNVLGQQISYRVIHYVIVYHFLGVCHSHSGLVWVTTVVNDNLIISINLAGNLSERKTKSILRDPVDRFQTHSRNPSEENCHILSNKYFLTSPSSKTFNSSFTIPLPEEQSGSFRRRFLHFKGKQQTYLIAFIKNVKLLIDDKSILVRF